METRQITATHQDSDASASSVTTTHPPSALEPLLEQDKGKDCQQEAKGSTTTSSTNVHPDPQSEEYYTENDDPAEPDWYWQCHVCTQINPLPHIYKDFNSVPLTISQFCTNTEVPFAEPTYAAAPAPAAAAAAASSSRPRTTTADDAAAAAAADDGDYEKHYYGEDAQSLAAKLRAQEAAFLRPQDVYPDDNRGGSGSSSSRSAYEQLLQDGFLRGGVPPPGRDFGSGFSGSGIGTAGGGREVAASLVAAAAAAPAPTLKQTGTMAAAAGIIPPPPAPLPTTTNKSPMNPIDYAFATADSSRTGPKKPVRYRGVTGKRAWPGLGNVVLPRVGMGSVRGPVTAGGGAGSGARPGGGGDMTSGDGYGAVLAGGQVYYPAGAGAGHDATVPHAGYYYAVGMIPPPSTTTPVKAYPDQGFYYPAAAAYGQVVPMVDPSNNMVVQQQIMMTGAAAPWQAHAQPAVAGAGAPSFAPFVNPSFSSSFPQPIQIPLSALTPPESSSHLAVVVGMCPHRRCEGCYDLDAEYRVVRFCGGSAADERRYREWYASFGFADEVVPLVVDGGGRDVREGEGEGEDCYDKGKDVFPGLDLGEPLEGVEVGLGELRLRGGAGGEEVEEKDEEEEEDVDEEGADDGDEEAEGEGRRREDRTRRGQARLRSPVRYATGESRILRVQHAVDSDDDGDSPEDRGDTKASSDEGGGFFGDAESDDGGSHGWVEEITVIHRGSQEGGGCSPGWSGVDEGSDGRAVACGCACSLHRGVGSDRSDSGSHVSTEEVASHNDDSQLEAIAAAAAVVGPRSERTREGIKVVQSRGGGGGRSVLGRESDTGAEGDDEKDDGDGSEGNELTNYAASLVGLPKVRRKRRARREETVEDGESSCASFL